MTGRDDLVEHNDLEIMILVDKDQFSSVNFFLSSSFHQNAHLETYLYYDPNP